MSKAIEVNSENRPGEVIPITGAQAAQVWMTPQEHPYTELIQQHLKEKKYVVDERQSEDGSSLSWVFSAGSVSMIFGVYETGNEIFFKLEAATNHVPKASAEALGRWLLETNTRLHHPLRLGINHQDMVVVQCWSYCDGFTPEHFKHRMETLLGFSESLQESLLKLFGAPPLYKDFEPPMKK